MVRALASHQCVLGSILGPRVICGLSLLLVLALAPRVFLRVLRFSNSIGNLRAPGLSVEDCCVSPSLNKVDLFIYLIAKLQLQHSWLSSSTSDPLSFMQRCSLRKGYVSPYVLEMAVYIVLLCSYQFIGLSRVVTIGHCNGIALD